MIRIVHFFPSGISCSLVNIGSPVWEPQKTGFYLSTEHYLFYFRIENLFELVVIFVYNELF